MPRRTPLEVFINGQTDRQAAYEKRRREQGLTKACAWVPADLASEWKEVGRLLCKHHVEPDGHDLVSIFLAAVERLKQADLAFDRAAKSAPPAPAR